MDDLKVITIKDLSVIMGVSYSTARQYYNDIRDYFKVKKITILHYKQYFRIGKY